MRVRSTSRVHALRKVRGAAVEHVQLLHPVGQELLAVGHFAAQLVKLMFGALGQLLFAQPVAQVVQLVGQFGLVAFEALEGVSKRAQPARFDQRLARQAQQAVEVFAVSRTTRSLPSGFRGQDGRRSRILDRDGGGGDDGIL